MRFDERSCDREDRRLLRQTLERHLERLVLQKGLCGLSRNHIVAVVASNDQKTLHQLVHVDIFHTERVVQTGRNHIVAQRDVDRYLRENEKTRGLKLRVHA